MFNFVNCMCVRQMFPKADIFIRFSFLGQLPHMYHWSLLSVIWICNVIMNACSCIINLWKWMHLC